MVENLLISMNYLELFGPHNNGEKDLIEPLKDMCHSDYVSLPDKMCHVLDRMNSSNTHDLFAVGKSEFKSVHFDRIPEDRLPIFKTIEARLSGTSLKNAIHMGQIYKTKTF